MSSEKSLEGRLAELAITEAPRPQEAVLYLISAAVRVAFACDRVDATKPVPGIPFTREMLVEVVEAAWVAGQPKQKAGLC